jgi:ribosomal protein S24E
MKLEIKSTKINPFFGRKEVAFVIDELVTPSRSSVRTEVAATLKVDINQLFVRHLETQSGSRQIIGLVHVYDDPSQALKVEPRHIIERNKP